MRLLIGLLWITAAPAATIAFDDLWGPAAGILDVDFGRTIAGFNFFWQDPGQPDALTVRINGTDVPAASGEFRWGAINGPLTGFRLTIAGDGVELRGGHVWHEVETPRCVDCEPEQVPETGGLLTVGAGLLLIVAGMRRRTI